MNKMVTVSSNHSFIEPVNTIRTLVEKINLIEVNLNGKVMYLLDDVELLTSEVKDLKEQFPQYFI